MPIYAYTHMRTHTSIYMHIQYYVYRRHHFQTRFGGELGKKFSQVKKAGKERGWEERKKRKEKWMVNKRHKIICRNKCKYANNQMECIQFNLLKDCDCQIRQKDQIQLYADSNRHNLKTWIFKPTWWKRYTK